MTLEQQKKRIEEYKKSLEAAIHYYDFQIQEVKNGLDKMLSQKENGLSDEALEEIKEFDWKGSPESFLDHMIEVAESSIFYASTFLPLLGVINVFKAKGKWAFSDANTVVEYNPDELVYSARKIYRIMVQLPESLVLNKLKEICIKNDTDLILDAFERRDEEAFIKAFELLQDKQSIKDYFLFIAKGMDVANGYGDFSAKAHNSIEELKDDADAVKQIRDEMIQRASTPAIIDATDGLSILLQTPPEPKDMKTAIKLYKTALSIYLVVAPEFDAITNEYANRIIQNPEYTDITQSLLAECKAIIMKVKLDQNQVPEGNHELVPLPFPYENIKIKKDKKPEFLEKIFECLLNPVNPDRPFIKNNQKEAFIYLFGGSEEKPNPCDPILWLRQKNELQAFLIVFFGENAGKNPGWSKLNNYFWLQNESTNPQLANSIGNLSEQIVYNLNSLLKPVIEEYTSGQD